MPERPYTYYDFTISICPECLRRVDAKIVFEDDKVYMLKHCTHHGSFKVLIASDKTYIRTSVIITSRRKRRCASTRPRFMAALMIVVFVTIMSSTAV